MIMVLFLFFVYCRSFSGRKDLTQAECYKFLSAAIHELREKHLLRQNKANEKMKQMFVQTLVEY